MIELIRTIIGNSVEARNGSENRYCLDQKLGQTDTTIEPKKEKGRGKAGDADRQIIQQLRSKVTDGGVINGVTKKEGTEQEFQSRKQNRDEPSNDA